MENLLFYLLKVNGLLLFFWIFYRLLLQKDTFYTFNRYYFLASVLISFLFPLIYFTKIEEIIIPASNLKTVQDNSNFVLNSTQIIETNWYENMDWLLISLVIIGIISMIKIGIRMFKINQLVRSIKSFENHPTEKNIKISDDNQQVYSFYKWIVLPKKSLNDENISVLIAHENIHIKQKHSFDLVFISFISDLFWFNPILKFIQKDINLNLEFLVDEEITKQENSYKYQKTLLNFNQNIETNLLTNAFNSTDLKKRILMLNSKKSNPMKKLKIALTAPVLLAFFGLFQIETIAQVKQETQKNDFITKNQIILESLQKDIKPIQEDKKVYNEIIENYKTTIDGKELSQKDLQEFDHSKIKSVTVDFTNSEKGTLINFMTTEEVENTRFKFSFDESVDTKVYIDENAIDVKDLINQSKHVPEITSYEKILIDGKESSFEELQSFYSKNIPFKVERENDIIIIETIKSNKKDNKLSSKNKPLYILDDKEISETEFRKIQPEVIESITVLKDENATDKYGEKGKNGVLIIQTKKYKKKELKENQKALNERKKAEIESKKVLVESRRVEIESKKALAESKRAEIESKKALIESNKAERERQKAVIEERKTLIEKRKSAIETKKAAIEKQKALAEENKNFELINTLFNDVKVDVKKLEDDDFKITSISTSLTKEDGTKISISEKY